MGSVLVFTSTNTNLASSCLDVVKEEKSRERPSRGQAVLVYNSLWDVFIVCFAKVTTLSVLVLAPLCTWLLSWSILQLRFLSWLVMLPGTTRRPGPSLDIFSWPSGMLRS